MTHARRRTAGFTLIELLTVLGIIALLIAILLPVIGKVQGAARVADTKNQMNKIASAIERYRQEQGAFPGVLPNSQFDNTTGQSSLVKVNGIGITMTENAVLALCGDMAPGNPPTVDVTSNGKIGQGPMTHVANVLRRTRLSPYIDPSPGSLAPPQYSGGWSNGAGTTSGNQSPSCDSDVPEFMDKFNATNPVRTSQAGMPILILRANVGATGVVHDTSSSAGGATYGPSGSTTFQYNMAWMRPYVEQTYLANRDPYNTSGNTGTAVTAPFNAAEFPARSATQGTTTVPVLPGAPSYFAHASIPYTPKGQNSYLLISAGPDGLFGTQDDIINVGG